MKKHILTDADGVLVFWVQGFEKFMEGKGHKLRPGTEREYKMTARYDIDWDTAGALIKEFNESDAIANLKPFADSVEYVKKLVDKGFRFTVVTSISSAPIAKINRTTNLTKIFGNIFDEIVCIDMGASKFETLKRWQGTGYFWIEDHMRQAEAGYEAGLKPILIEQPYNEHYSTDLFPIVSYDNPWKEIYHMVCEEYKIEP